MKKLIMIVVAFAAALGVTQPANAEKLDTPEKLSDSAELPAREILNSSKTWSVKLSTEIEASTFNRDNVYVIDEHGDKLTTLVQYKEGTKEGVVRAPSIGYEENIQHTLVITDGVESTKGVALAQGVKMNFELSGEGDDSRDKSIHDYSKAELEAWIDEEVDFERLGAHPINNGGGISETVAEANYSTLHPTGDLGSDRTELVMEILNDSSQFMDIYFNRDYQTIGDDWINKVRRHFVSGFTYKGDYYSQDQLPSMFDRFVQETKYEKRNSESIFVSDKSMVFEQNALRESGYGSEYQVITRGTQYIRYTSGTNLSEGVELNKWCKRDIDVDAGRGNIFGEDRPWESMNFLHEGIYPITSYEEVTK